MAKKKGKPLEKRVKEFEQLKVMSHQVEAFNDHFHLRVLAPNGETIEYFPVSEKYRKKGSNITYSGIGNLMDYLNEVS